MRKTKFYWALIAAISAVFMVGAVALASSVDVAVVDVTAPTGSVTVAPGGSASITINMSVTGAQAGSGTFKVNRDWSLSGGSFTGSNPVTFNVPARNAQDAPMTFSTSGTVSVASGQTDGTFSLAAGAFDITNTNQQGAKLAAGSSSIYQVTVETPAPSDSTPPGITITTPGNNATYFLNEAVNADYSCTDEAGGSGLASCVGDVANGAAIDTSSIGSHTFTVNAADNAGNTSSASATYKVIWDFDGFFQPIDNLPTLNTAKAGSAIPVKFSLNGNQGLSILAAGSPASKVASCDASADTDAIEQTVTAGQSSLQYDAASDRYTYVWKTDKSWAGTCRQLQVKLADGMTYAANFKLAK